MSQAKGLENLDVFGELENWRKEEPTASKEEEKQYLAQQREEIARSLLTDPSISKENSPFHLKAKKQMIGETINEQPTPPVEFKVIDVATYAKGINHPEIDKDKQTIPHISEIRFLTKEGRKLDYTFLNSITAIYYKAGTDKFKIDLDSRILKDLDPNFNKAFVPLTGKNAYSRMKGKGVKEFYRTKGSYGKHLTRKEFLEHEVYRFIFGVEEGLNKKELEQNPRYQLMMKIADKVYGTEKQPLREIALGIWPRPKNKIKQDQARSVYQNYSGNDFLLGSDISLNNSTRFVSEVAPKK